MGRAHLQGTFRAAVQKNPHQKDRSITTSVQWIGCVKSTQEEP